MFFCLRGDTYYRPESVWNDTCNASIATKFPCNSLPRSCQKRPSRASRFHKETSAAGATTRRRGTMRVLNLDNVVSPRHALLDVLLPERITNDALDAMETRAEARHHGPPEDRMRIFEQNWMQVEARLEREVRAVLPLGSTEQHAYLSLGTDSILAERVAVEAAEPLGV